MKEVLTSILTTFAISSCLEEISKQDEPEQNQDDTASIYASIDTQSISRIDYSGFTLWMDCSKKAAFKFEYTIANLVGNASATYNNSLDTSYVDCQQTSSSDYQASSGINYDAAQLVPAKHMDDDTSIIQDTYYMTNILPQIQDMHRGAWQETEDIAECYGKDSTVEIYGGVLWEITHIDESFKLSHGIDTPSHFWKMLVYNDTVLAWIIPNTQDANSLALDRYVTQTSTLLDILEQINVDIDYNYISTLEESNTWSDIYPCN
jgi:endonuclease G, mitochondrial